MLRWSDGREHILPFTKRHLTSLVVSDVHSHIRQQRQHVWSLNKVPHPLSGKKTDDPSRGKRRSRSGKRGSEPHHGDGSWYRWVPLDYKNMLQKARFTLRMTFQAVWCMTFQAVWCWINADIWLLSRSNMLTSGIIRHVIHTFLKRFFGN